MSDNEYEAFEITDYDLHNEFNINRPRRRLTRNQQIYGIWADDSDNENELQSSQQRNRRGHAGLGSSGNGGRKDYTAPVSFVAGGIQQSGKKKKEDETASVDNNITDEEDMDGRPSFGRKQPSLLDDESSNSNSSDSSEVESHSRRSKSQHQTINHKSSYVPSNRNVGTWERHTRGIGAKLLLQMGYKPGMGLGKDLQGIAQPVEAHVRKGRGAIGAYGPEVGASIGGKGTTPRIDEDERETKVFKEKLNTWKKDGSRQERTKRYYYESVEDIIEKNKKGAGSYATSASTKLSNVPVIDMTGPEKRVLSGYHALGHTKIVDEELYEMDCSTSTKKPQKSETKYFALPELLHNLNLLVELSEQEIIALDKSEYEANCRIVTLEQEYKNRKEIVKLEQDHIESLEKSLAIVDAMIEGGEDLEIESAEKMFLKLKHDFASEYKEFGLAELAAGVIAPLVKKRLESWQPLEQPTMHIDLIKKWRSILVLQNEQHAESQNVFDPYSSLIWAGVVPSIRSGTSNWNPKQHQSMAALLDAWAPLFPSWILDSVLEQLVLQRLNVGVREWDPLTDTVPIHIWILPWNSILGNKMEEYIFPTIQEKLGNALLAWMPHDRSARAMLAPWKGYFNDAEMQAFLLQHIIPKLQMVLNEFIINPLQQNLEPWNQVWEWREVIPPILMGQLLDKFFFPKWMQVLMMWLNQSPDFLEVSRWYSGWKNMFTDEIIREPNVKEHLRRALEIMHRSSEAVGTPLIGLGPPQQSMPRMTTTPPPPPVPPSLMEMQLAAPAQLEFKELVSQKCAERGIVFAPLPGRREFGKQIYRVGNLNCYIDRNVCMISNIGMQNWAPTSLSDLIDKAATGLV